MIWLSAAASTASARPGAVRKCTERRAIPGSNAFVPSVVGLIIAGEVVKDLTDADTRAKMKTGGKA